MLNSLLKQLRISKGLSQTDVAQHLNITRQAYGHYETNKRSPSLDTIHQLSEFYGVSLDYLLGRDEDAKKEPDATHGTELSSGEQALIQLFRRVPSDKRELVLAMIEAALQSGGLL